MKNLFKDKAFVTLLLTALVAVTCIIGAMSIGSGKDITDLNEPTKQDELAKQETTTETPTSKEKEEPSSNEQNVVSSSKKAKDDVQKVAGDVTTLSFNADSSLVWPVDGSVILEYNMDNTIYFPTLNEYKCNPALVLQADKDLEVVAASEGIVKEIGNDEEIGNYVVMSLGDGYELTYGQLNKLSLTEGQVIKEKDVIGTIAEPTKYYVNEGYNLYLRLEDSKTTLDPLEYLDYK